MTSPRNLIAPAMIGLLLIAALGAAAASRAPAPIAAAFAAPGRTAADKGEDVHRKGQALLVFAGVKRGDKVMDLIPGGGYFTRLFSRVVGSTGHVYSMWPDEYARESVMAVADLKAQSGQAPYTNVTVYTQPAAAFSAPEPLDLVFTSQNYHDYNDPFMGQGSSSKQFARQVYAALKPGGVFLVIDHVAEKGSGLRDTDTRHRIDPATIKAEVLAAGFRYAGEINVLRNPADDHKLTVFDKPIRGHTDQVVFKFIKPAARRR